MSNLNILDAGKLLKIEHENTPDLVTISNFSYVGTGREYYVFLRYRYCYV